MTSDFLTKLQVLLGFVLLFIVGPLSYLLIRGIVGPVYELTEVANKFSLGNLDLDIPVKDRKDEIGKLASAIVRLGTSIQLALERLGSRIEDIPTPARLSPPPQKISDVRSNQIISIPGIISAAKKSTALTLSEKAQITVLLFDHWRLHWKDQLVLLGLKDTGPEVLARISAGKSLPGTEDFEQRLSEFVKIYDALQFHTRQKTMLSPLWIKNANAFFDNHSPLEIVEKKGISGLVDVTEIICEIAARSQ